MKDTKFNCGHICKNTCDVLNKALGLESSILELYINAVDECTLPEAKSLLSHLIDEKREVLNKLKLSLDELQEKSHIIDDIAESYNKEVE